VRQKASIPLIRAATIAPLFNELKQAGALREVLRRTKLPSDLNERLGEFVPARIALHFMAESASFMETPTLGFDTATRTRVDELGQWGHSIARCYTLRAALKLLCILYPLEASFLQMGLVEDGPHAWLWRRRTLAPKDSAGETQGEQFTLGLLIHVVGLFAGSQWSPPAIRIESRVSESALHIEGLEQTRLEFGGPVLAIAIPRVLLDRRLPRPPSSRSTTGQGGAPAANDFVRSLVQALELLATEAPLTLDLGAEIAETSPRTLQRRLAQERTNWRSVVDRARFEASDRLLSNSSLSLVEIATTLGYSDHAHFTRAFHRWTGEAPSVYRHRQMADGG
jgi:AraC-like DNA-binding protein